MREHRVRLLLEIEVKQTQNYGDRLFINAIKDVLETLLRDGLLVECFRAEGLSHRCPAVESLTSPGPRLVLNPGPDSMRPGPGPNSIRPGPERGR